jgi:formylglycine-generating enzyme
MRTRVALLAALGATLAAASIACTFVRDLDELEPGPAAADASSDAAAVDGAGGDAGGRCPSGMADEQLADGTRFCIDRTEVSQEAYARFLAADAGPRPDGCEGNASLDPGAPEPEGGERCAEVFDPVGHGTLPVVCVDHCDARAYCQWRGARLCGGKRGGSLDATGLDQPSQDEWFVACAGAGRAFATGADVGGCVFGRQGPEPVGSRGCTTPEQVEHLSGNVREWTSTCRSAAGGEASCLVRGGGFAAMAPKELRCAHDEGDRRPATTRALAVGFRCCRDR